MPKVHLRASVGRNKNLFSRIVSLYTTQSKSTRFSIAALFLILLTIPVVTSPFAEQVENHAAPLTSATQPATISLNPATGNFMSGANNQFTVSLTIDGGGQTFNAAQATVGVSNLVIDSLTPGTCNFSWLNNNYAPTAADPSFVGALLGTSASSCTVYSVTVHAVADGPASITISSANVISSTSHTDMLGSIVSGNYTIGPLTPTPTAIPTEIPTVTPTVPVLTATPIPTNTPFPSPTPTITPLPTVTLIPTATPTSAPTATPAPLLAPTFDSSIPKDTYSGAVTLSGTKDPSVTTVFLNNSSSNISYPTQTTWQTQTPVTLNISYTSPSVVTNTFTVYGTTTQGTQTPSNSISINRHHIGDINGNGKVDIFDLSALSNDWLKGPSCPQVTGPLSNPMTDITSDGCVNIFDLSQLSSNWLWQAP